VNKVRRQAVGFVLGAGKTLEAEVLPCTLRTNVRAIPMLPRGQQFSAAEETMAAYCDNHWRHRHWMSKVAAAVIRDSGPLRQPRRYTVRP
jgi:hypothetical protein